MKKHTNSLITTHNTSIYTIQTPIAPMKLHGVGIREAQTKQLHTQKNNKNKKQKTKKKQYKKEIKHKTKKQKKEQPRYHKGKVKEAKTGTTDLRRKHNYHGKKAAGKTR